VRIRVRLFASYAEAVGRDEIAIELPAGARLADALQAVRASVGTTRLPPMPLLALNLRYAKPDSPLSDGDEVALIPPVAGG
jgi:molybdopterin converting factor subunit 1